MKKRILSVVLALVLLFSLAGCKAGLETEEKADISSMFVCVDETNLYKVVYNKKTKVMYAVSIGTYNHGTFTVLVDTDGNPMIWEK